MIKKGAIRRILVASIALILVVVALYIFPENEVKIPTKTIHKKVNTSGVYLIDHNNYVARTYININNKDKEKMARELIEALINGTNKNKYLPNGFSSYINNNAKINNIVIEDDLVQIDFNDSLFLNNQDHDEKILEMIVYTLTEIEGIKRVQILINGEILDRLPSSNKILPLYLTRDIGINHKSLISDFKNTKNVTIYFKSTYEDLDYFVPVTFTLNSEEEKVEIIINQLSGKDYIDDNLSTYISAGTLLKNYQILEDEISLDFNNVIFNSFDKIDEEVMYGISLSIYDNYNISNVSFEVDSKKIDSYALKKSWLCSKVII